MRALGRCGAQRAPPVVARAQRRAAPRHAARAACSRTAVAAALRCSPLCGLAAPRRRCRVTTLPPPRAAADGDDATPDAPASPPATSPPPPTPPPGEDDEPDAADVAQAEAVVEEIIQTITLQRFFTLLIELGGVKGTLAVALAFLLKIDPFGGFQPSAPDALLGLALAAPILLTDALLMVPPWEPSWEAPGTGESAALSAFRTGGATQVLSAADVVLSAEEAAAAAAAAQAAVPAIEPPPEVGFLRAAQDAAALFQRIKVTNNPAEGMAVWQEGCLVLVGHLADEAFARAVILGGLVAWLKDRALEADLDPVQSDVAAPWVALGMVVIFEVGRKRRALFRQLQVEAAMLGRDAATGKVKVTSLPEAALRTDIAAAAPRAPEGTSAAATNAASAAVQRLQAQVRAAKERAQSAAQIDAVRSISDWLSYGGAFLLTHNLFASWTASVVTDAAFSAYQRLGGARLRQREKAKWDAATAALKRKAAAALAARGVADEDEDDDGKMDS